MLNKAEFETAVVLEMEWEDPGAEDPSLVHDLGLDSLELLRLSLLLDRLLPGLELPEQLNLEDVKLSDVYYYYRVGFEQRAAADRPPQS